MQGVFHFMLQLNSVVMCKCGVKGFEGAKSRDMAEKW